MLTHAFHHPGQSARPFIIEGMQKKKKKKKKKKKRIARLRCDRSSQTLGSHPPNPIKLLARRDGHVAKLAYGTRKFFF